MADFYGCLESTSFRVKDRQAFLDDPDVKRIQRETAEGFFEEDPLGYFAFGWYGQYPSVVLQDVDDDIEPEPDGFAVLRETDIAEVVQRHIRPGDVCRIGISGNEKLRYIGGPMVWITTQGIATFDGGLAWDEKLVPAKVRENAEAFLRELRAITEQEAA